MLNAPADSAPSVADATAAARHILGSEDVDLPLLPEVSIQLMKMTSDINCDPADIVDLLRRDQSLTGHLLQMSNSARYSSGATVTSIQQAVARLGLMCIREVVMLISCQSKVFDVPAFEADVRQSFTGSLATAAFSQEIARVRRLNVEDAFLCGLLHDIGRPVLLQALVDHFEDSAPADDELRSAADAVRIPMASRMALSWELPQRLARTIEHQDTPLEAGDLDQQAAMLRLAIDVAALAIEADSEWPETLDHPMLEVLNLYPEDLAPVAQRKNEIVEWIRST